MVRAPRVPADPAGRGAVAARHGRRRDRRLLNPAEPREVATVEAPDGLLVGVRELLEAAFGTEFTDADWAHTLGGRHVIVEEDGAVVSHAAVVPRDIEIGGCRFFAGYVEGVATAPHRQRQGIGAAVMAAVEAIIRREFALGVLSTGRVGLYRRHGWKSWRGPSFVRRGAESIRTADEDDGIMVLRFGASADTDLGAPISCEARTGDDW